MILDRFSQKSGDFGPLFPDKSVKINAFCAHIEPPISKSHLRTQFLMSENVHLMAQELSKKSKIDLFGLGKVMFLLNLAKGQIPTKSGLFPGVKWPEWPFSLKMSHFQ